MRLLADENIPSGARARLRALGHDVVVAVDVLGRGARDAGVVRLAGMEGRVVVSTDDDFCRLRPPAGCVVIRLARPGARGIAEAAVRGVSRLASARGLGRVVVARERSVRLLPKRPL